MTAAPQHRLNAESWGGAKRNRPQSFTGPFTYCTVIVPFMNG